MRSVISGSIIVVPGLIYHARSVDIGLFTTTVKKASQSQPNIVSILMGVGMGSTLILSVKVTIVTDTISSGSKISQTGRKIFGRKLHKN